jgi:MFS family permease
VRSRREDPYVDVTESRHDCEYRHVRPFGEDDEEKQFMSLSETEPSVTESKPLKKKRFYGWNIVIASALTNGFGGSVHWQGFTVFFIPISQTLGLSAAQTAIPFALSRAESGLMGPITGWLFDKYGVKRLMIIGTIMSGVGYILLAQTSTFFAFVFVYLFVISIGSSTSFMQASTTALNTWFSRRRGMVMSINSAAFRLGGSFMVPLLSVVVLRWGWQTAAMWVGIGMLIFITPLAFVYKRSPESMGVGPDGDSLKHAHSESGLETGELEESDDDWTVKDAIRTRAFWTLVAGTVLRMSVHGTIFVHFVPILVWKGESQQTAANLIGALALCSVPLIVFFGWFSDRVGRPPLLAGCYLAAASSLLLLTVVDGTWPIFVAMLLFTGTEIGSGLNWALVGDLFGRKRYATIRGLMAPIYNTPLFIMPIAAGWVFDETGSYKIVMWVGSGLLVAASLTFLTIKKPVHQSKSA